VESKQLTAVIFAATSCQAWQYSDYMSAAVDDLHDEAHGCSKMDVGLCKSQFHPKTPILPEPATASKPHHAASIEPREPAGTASLDRQLRVTATMIRALSALQKTARPPGKSSRPVPGLRREDSMDKRQSVSQHSLCAHPSVMYG